MPHDESSPAGDIRCTHCGLPVPAGLVEPGQDEQFCCNGCRTVYQVIHGCGLDRFYRLREAADAGAEPAQTTGRQYSEFDDAVFRGLYYQALGDGTQSVELYLEGVHCAACVWLVEKLPQVLPGVVEARLDMRRCLVAVRWDQDQVALSRIARMLDSLGYPPHPAKDAKARDLRRREDHRFLIRIGVAGACMGNVMTLAFALYGGVFEGIEAQYAHLFRWASMGFGLIALVWPGSLFFRGAWAALRTRTAHLDLPIALGLIAGGLAGSVNAVRGQGEIYFDSLTMLVFLLLVGRWIQRRQQRWASDAVELLFSLTPTSCRRIEGEDGVICEVPIEAVRPGDLVEVRAGDSIPTDGVIADGESNVDQSLLTGESVAVSVAAGDPVAAGTVNVSSRLVVRVEAVGDQTRVGKLMKLVERCSSERAPVVRFADRVAGWFVVVVLALAAVTFVAWLVIEPERAVDNAIALLIVTCPCALGLATPLAVTVALGRAARRGILIKGGEALELLGRRGAIVLDKTGTITAGRTSVVTWHGDESIQPLVAALESHSAHPIAKAITEHVVGVYALACSEDTLKRELQRGDTLKRELQQSGTLKRTLQRSHTLKRTLQQDVADVQQVTGGGLTGLVNGRRLVVGSPAFVAGQGVASSEPMLQFLRETIAAGNSPVLVAVEGECQAVIGVGDPVRADSKAAVENLDRLGWDVHILSGDHPDVVAAVGSRLQVATEKAIGGATPEAKVAYVRQLAKQGAVVMAGDGVNDAAALSAATVGIAVHGGAEASLAAADIYLNRPGLMPITQLILAARATQRTIRRSLVASLCYNAIAASLAVTGLISPLIAAILMPISSFTVLALAYSSRTFRAE